MGKQPQRNIVMDVKKLLHVAGRLLAKTSLSLGPQ